MKLWSRMRGRKESTAGPANAAPSALDNPEEWLLKLLIGGFEAQAGVKVTPLKAMGVATVYACVNVLARSLGTLPLKLHRMDGDRREVVRDHPLNDLVGASPNEEMTSADFRMALQSHLSLRNNAYAQIVRNRGGDIVELLPLHPKDVQVLRDSQTRQLVYQICGERHPQRDVLHLRGLSGNGLVGMDLITTVHDVMGLAMALEMNAAKFFANDSKPGTVFQTDSALSPEAYRRLKESLEENQGVEGAYKAKILEEGLKVANTRSENDASQFDESRERQDKQIARVFGLPPHKVGIMGEATFSNIEQQNIEFVTDTLTPIVVLWEQSLNKWLLSPQERRQLFFKFDLRGLLRGDVRSRFEAYSKGRQWGWMSVNEIRALEEMNPIEGGDEYLNPLNMVPAGYLPAGAVKEADDTD